MKHIQNTVTNLVDIIPRYWLKSKQLPHNRDTLCKYQTNFTLFIKVAELLKYTINI